MSSGRNDDDEIGEILDGRNGRSALDAGAPYLERDPELRGPLEIADLAWESEQSAPPLAEDPVAALLGLVPDPEIELDGKALASARKQAGFTVSTLAARLTARGWDVSGKDVFSWESGRNAPHVPALINAIAQETGTDSDRLRRRNREDPERAKLAAVIASATFKNLAQRWARIQGTTVDLAASALESRMLVAVHRGGAPDEEILLDSLEAMITAVESSADQ